MTQGVNQMLISDEPTGPEQNYEPKARINTHFQVIAQKFFFLY